MNPKLKRVVSKAMVRFERGRWYASILQFLMILALFFQDAGTKVIIWILLAGIFGLWLIGYLDDKYGWLRSFKDYSTEITPFWKKMSDKIDNIEKKLNNVKR